MNKTNMKIPLFQFIFEIPNYSLDTNGKNRNGAKLVSLNFFGLEHVRANQRYYSVLANVVLSLLFGNI